MKERESSPPEREYLPRHVGIIMDGNGRWAKARGLPREMGHRAGSKVVGEIIRHCKKTGIPTITIYALSTENWKRPQKEVDALLELLRRYLSNMEEYQRENARLIVLGDAAPLPPDLREAFDFAAARAVADLRVLAELCLPFVKVGGWFLAMKGTDCGAELEQALPTIQALGGRAAEPFDYTIPHTEVAHRVVRIEKIGPAPSQYPRRWAKIQKEGQKKAP